MRRFFLISTIFMGLLLAGCGASKQINGKVINKVTSPNGKIDAIVSLSSKGGATVPSISHVYLKTNSNGVNYQIMEAEVYYYPIRINWIDDNHLIINVPYAKISSYTNFFDVISKNDLAYQISIKLRNKGLCRIYVSNRQGFSSCLDIKNLSN